MSASESAEQAEVIDEIDVVSMEDGKPPAIEDTSGSTVVESQEKTTENSKETTQDGKPPAIEDTSGSTVVESQEKTTEDSKETTQEISTPKPDTSQQPLPSQSSSGDTSLQSSPTSDSQDALQCYCGKPKSGVAMFYCDSCKKYFHPSCLKSGNPTTLEGDIFFKFVCSSCSSTDQETVERMKITWQQVVILSLYNLSLHKSGRKGYFRWKEDICEFISQHWTLIFGQNKSKTQTWHGTVAGVLSVGNKVLFRSGAQEFGESGWWCLIENKPPAIKPEVTGLGIARSNLVRKAKIPFEPTIKLEGLRNRKRGSSVESAIELKEKRSRTQEAKDIRKAKLQSEEQIKRKTQKDIIGDIDDSSLDSFPGSECLGLPPSVPDSPSVLSLLGGDNSSDSLLTSLLNESDLTPAETVPMTLMAGDEEDIIPPSKGVSLLRTPTPQLSSSQSSDSSQMSLEKDGFHDTEVAMVIPMEEGSPEVITKVTKVKKSKVAEAVSEVMGSKGPKYLPMSVYEERQLLRILEACPQAVECDPAARRFRRKLLVRQEKRERGLPLFDLDSSLQQTLQCRTNIIPSFAANLLMMQSPLRQPYVSGLGMTGRPGGDYRILDRFQMPQFSVRTHQHLHTTFRARLVGCNEEMMMQSIISPYTARILKPFIRRDTETKPLKLKLMQEILNHPKRLDPTFEPPPLAPIDYCYVRPQHIPSVNALCREFFWPGIDLSECLQYPDFSVVVLYRKVVIGFGFMVPDVKYNEAYISFLFVHPEWRNAGIAKFMVYHLIQTCMGKDVTLHVDATNSAMLLYQKFGFKPEEFILDFYDKYYPEDSKHCTHAFFLRLRR